MNNKKIHNLPKKHPFKLNKVIQIFLLCMFTLSCMAFKSDKNQIVKTEKESDKQQQLVVSLTFQKNDAEKAMNFYVELFENSKIKNIHRWGKEGPGKEGTIMIATFELNGMQFMCSDSPPVHNWDFSPAVSIYVDCKNEEEIERLFTKLSENGEAPMPLANYGFSQKFGWVIDQFGVSWQLNLN